MSTRQRSSAAQTVARVERDRTSAMLDEALRETFPASDPVSITPARRNVDEDDAIASGAADPAPADAGALGHSLRHGREGNRQ